MATKQKLVVIGNGMAGARAVEEILARGGADQFEITMFGEEPYGNYNRILLSDVLNGSHEAEDIFLNPLGLVRGQRHQAARGRQGLQDLAPRAADRSRGRHRRELRPADHRHRQPALHPADGRLTLPDGSDKPGVFVFRNLDDCRKITAYAMGKKRGVVIGGGLLGLEAARGLQNFSLDVHVIQRGNAIMGQQLDDPAAAILKKTLEGLGIVVHTNKDTRAIRGHDQVTGLGVQGRHAPRLRLGGDRRGHQGQQRARAARWFGGRARHRGRQSPVHGRPADLCGRRMRAAPRPSVRLGRAALGAGQSAGRSPHRHATPTPRTMARRSPPS